MIFKSADSIECNIEKHDCCASNKVCSESCCPECGEKGKSVPEITLTHLLKEEVKSAMDSLEGFHFCKTPECDTVYFRGDVVLHKDDLSVPVGIKEGAVPATVCYCFGWSKEKMAREIGETGRCEALEDIKSKMKTEGCSCEILNPSGRCCLEDVKRILELLGANV